ncbi:unnamed protein product [Albugo candida]|uniref:Uncharacterized protein n=1 Tax=Albugo candida TaxID=65357 RepID=A0A024GEH3_9STRA|nr:unnamed protein product [Albugo candida]|eukprot:CCI45089.1 unnamed protein product [Albugo candida]
MADVISDFEVVATAKLGLDMLVCFCIHKSSAPTADISDIVEKILEMRFVSHAFVRDSLSLMESSGLIRVKYFFYREDWRKRMELLSDCVSLQLSRNTFIRLVMFCCGVINKRQVHSMFSVFIDSKKLTSKKRVHHSHY